MPLPLDAYFRRQVPASQIPTWTQQSAFTVQPVAFVSMQHLPNSAPDDLVGRRFIHAR
jgi:hypothetical protein